MKPEKTLELLNLAIYHCDEMGRSYLNELIQECQDEIFMATKPQNLKPVIKKFPAFWQRNIKKLGGHRDILRYADRRTVLGKEYQIFCDSYRIFAFAQERNVPYHDSDQNYPTVYKIITEEALEADNTFTMTFAEAKLLKADRKTNPYAEVKTDKGTVLYLNAQFLHDAFNYTGSDILTFHVTDPTSPVFAKTPYDDIIVIVPCRNY